MPQQFMELGAEYLKQQRDREQEKNRNAMSKMRIEGLEREAQSYDDKQQGATETMREVAPVVAMWQDQAAQMTNETARANRRATYAEIASLQSMAARDPGARAAMGDVLTQHKNMIRMQVLGDYMEGREVDPFLASYAMGPESAQQLPGVKAEKEYRSTLAGEKKFKKQDAKEIRSQWQSEMNSMRRSGVAGGYEEDDIAEQQRIESARYVSQMEDLGMTPTDTMYAYAGMEPPSKKAKAPVHTPESMALLTAKHKGRAWEETTEAQRLARQEGEPVFAGREDITYGKAPTQLTRKEETGMLRDAYRKSIEEALGPTPSSEIEDLIDELLAGEGKPKEKKPYGGKVKFKYQTPEPITFGAKTEKDIAAWKERERIRKEREEKRARPFRRMRGGRK